jgi:hypothetical protein
VPMHRGGTRRFAVAGLVAALGAGGAAVGLEHRPAHAAVIARPPVSLTAASTADPATPAVERTTPARLPFGKGPIFPGHFLVAYYGTAGTGSLGVLGEDDPDAITTRLRKAAKPFGSAKRPVQIVYELIVTVADGSAGPDGDYSHDISRDKVQTFIDAAHRNKALLVLDLQTGRSGFLTVAKRWKWALEDPWVGLALDPEWRMGPHQVPAQVIGSVSAREVNRTSGWLSRLATSKVLPQKLFLLHTFRTSMLRNAAAIKSHKQLAMVEHVDGFGTPSQKLATYHAVARPKQFTMGFKLFYDEDIHRMSAKRVKQIRPRVSFVSFQ